MSAPAPRLSVPVRRWWLWVLLGVGLALCAVSVAWQTAKRGGWQPASLQLDRILSIDEDLSILNWLTTSTFLLAAFVAASTAATAGRVWWWVAGTLALISLDDAVGLHAPLKDALLNRLADDPPLTLLAALLAAAAVGTGLVLLALQALPRPVAWRLAACVALILAGAVGVDSVGPNPVNDPVGRLTALYVAKSTLEEACELAAAVLALDTVLLGALRGTWQPLCPPGRQRARGLRRRSVRS